MARDEMELERRVYTYIIQMYSYKIPHQRISPENTRKERGVDEMWNTGEVDKIPIVISIARPPFCEPCHYLYLLRCSSFQCTNVSTEKEEEEGVFQL